MEVCQAMRDAVFFGHFDDIHKIARETVSRIPPHKLDFRPTDDMMSARELAFHMFAQEKVLLNGCRKGTIEEKDFADVDSEIAEMDTPADLVAYGEKIHAATNDWATSASDEEYGRTVKTFFGDTTPFMLISGSMEHVIHHRGQLYVYLRILGVEPPDVFGPTEGA
jgi:uncharacterized damage-inducible protein DinB